MTSQQTRIGIYGWGIVAPRSPNIAAFADNLTRGGSWLTPFDACGPTTFLVGEPDFDFTDYRPWIDERFPPSKFRQLRSKMGMPTQYAIGAFIQALGDNPGLERTLRELGPEAQVMVGTGLGDLPTQYESSVALYRAQFLWNMFWAEADVNSDRRRWDEADAEERTRLRAEWAIPEDPSEETLGTEAWRAVQKIWNDFWMRRSDGLQRFLEEFDAIEGEGVADGDIHAGKMALIRRKKTQMDRLLKRWACPKPPWMAVSANLLWNIHNTPASQVSMMGKITGLAFAPVGACASFGVALHLAMNAIRGGEAKAVVVGMTDPPPHTLTVGSFYSARILACDRSASIPLTDLKGTHASGGACIWVLGDHEYMSARGLRPVGLELLGAGVSSDADHIITPSKEGPQEAIRRAFAASGADPGDIGTWDLHATATPGDFQEVSNLSEMIPKTVIVTARKGTFGHGMSAAGGWEMTAQHLGVARGEIFPTPIRDHAVHEQIRGVPFAYVEDLPLPAPPGLAGKLSMGVGGVNSCVIARRWGDRSED